jgi:hypothetical protein
MNRVRQNSLRKVHQIMCGRIALILGLRKRMNSRMHPPSFQPAFLLIPIFAVMGFGGCPKQPLRAKFAQNGVTKPPAIPVLDIDTTPPEITASDMRNYPPQLFTAPSSPARPPAVRRATTTTEPDPEPTKREAPQISPQLSPEEQSRAKASYDADIRAAQQDLDTASHHSLNATQQDMADKIRSFLAQALDAKNAADWLRAKNLANKAHVLSTELIRSF